MSGIEANEYHGNGYAPKRKPYLEATLNTPISPIEVGPTQHDGTIAIVPIHQSQEAMRTIRWALRSIQGQWNSEGIHVVIADNGLDDDHRRVLNEQVAGLGISAEIIDAFPKTELDKSAAYARNEAVRYLVERSKESPLHRSKGILFVDSDTILAPWAEEVLRKTLLEQSNAVAVTAKSIPVNHIDETTLQSYMTVQPLPEGIVRPLPSLLNNGSVDMGKIIGWSGDVATKTCGLYLDNNTVRQMLNVYPDLLLRMPHGSAEDMILSLGLSRYGKVYHNSAAEVLDQARDTYEGVRKQRANWGTDHVSLFSDMIQLGYVTPGIRVLEPKGNLWYEWVVPGTEDRYGLIINPTQLLTIRSQLQEMIEVEGFQEIVGSIGLHISEKELSDSLMHFDQLSEIVKKSRYTVEAAKRVDLPEIVLPDENIHRWSRHSRVGQFLGNIRGMHDIQYMTDGKLPVVSLFGVRQAGNWS